MLILALDTASTLCAACVYDTADDRELGRDSIDIGKGHAEHLMAVIDRALAQAGKTYRDIDRIAVSIGPGSFTGIRVGVSAARGLALALKIPAVGVTTLEALAAEAGRPCLAAIDLGRGGIAIAVYDELGRLAYGPHVTTPSQAQSHLPPDAVLCGTAARAIADAGAAGRILSDAGTADIAAYARLAATKDPAQKPVPLYLRDADAKPQAGFVLPRRAPG